MTPRKKAEELIKWAVKYGASKDVAKLFAMKIVDEITEECQCQIGLEWFWQEVKQEIEKL